MLDTLYVFPIYFERYYLSIKRELFPLKYSKLWHGSRVFLRVLEQATLSHSFFHQMSTQTPSSLSSSLSSSQLYQFLILGSTWIALPSNQSVTLPPLAGMPPLNLGRMTPPPLNVSTAPPASCPLLPLPNNGLLSDGKYEYFQTNKFLFSK